MEENKKITGKNFFVLYCTLYLWKADETEHNHLNKIFRNLENIRKKNMAVRSSLG